MPRELPILIMLVFIVITLYIHFCVKSRLNWYKLLWLRLYFSAKFYFCKKTPCEFNLSSFGFNLVKIMLMQEDGSKNEGSWSFQDESQAYSANPEPGERAQFQPISWTGSEFISNQKNSSWYFSLAVFIVVICVAIYLISKDILSVVFISIMGILFGVVASRKPRQLEYAIDEDGIKVGTKIYLYDDFKSFSMQQHDAIGYVSLLPLHRFHNELSIYFPPDHEEQVFNALAYNLPNEQRKENYIDKLSKFVRF